MKFLRRLWCYMKIEWHRLRGPEHQWIVEVQLHNLKLLLPGQSYGTRFKRLFYALCAEWHRGSGWSYLSKGFTGAAEYHFKKATHYERQKDSLRLSHPEAPR